VCSNGKAYSIGEYVLSGDELLRRAARRVGARRKCFDWK
jgi:hypothetical protein